MLFGGIPVMVVVLLGVDGLADRSMPVVMPVIVGAHQQGISFREVSAYREAPARTVD